MNRVKLTPHCNFYPLVQITFRMSNNPSEFQDEKESLPVESASQASGTQQTVESPSPDDAPNADSVSDSVSDSAPGADSASDEAKVMEEPSSVTDNAAPAELETAEVGEESNNQKTEDPAQDLTPPSTENNAESETVVAAQPDAEPEVQVSEAATSEAATSEAASTPPVADGVTADQSDQATPTKPAMKIGSQRRDAAGDNLVPKAVKDAQTTTVPIAKEEVPKAPEVPVGPSVDELGSQWEKEAEASLDTASVKELLETASADADLDLPVSSRLKGTVTKVHGDGVFFLLKGQYDGVLPLKQFKKEPEPGTMTDVVITGFNSEESLYELALPGAAVAVADWSDINVGNVVQVRIVGSNTGGLECSINGIRGFIPASQIDVSRVENLGTFVNQTLECVITEANKKKRNLVLSRRVILEKALKERKKEILEQFEVGSTMDGKITKLRDFGAFVNIGSGVEGLIHISKCSWHHIKHPSEVFQEGQDVSVRLEKINKETGKIQLSHRDTVEHPWKRVNEKYPAETTVSGTVSKVADFGAFIKLETGIEGLVHISEIAHERVKSVGAVLNEGQTVEVKILSVDPDKQKMSLSIKALLPVPEKSDVASKKKNEANEPPREMAVKKRNKPLKGGTGGGAGGDQFGLKW